MDYLSFIEPTNVAMYVGLVVPFLVAVVSKKVASSGLKGVLNLLLSSIAGSAVYLASDVDTYDVRGFVTASLNTFVVSVAAYYGVYKPTGATASVNSATANFGLGKPVLQTDDTEIPLTTTPDEMGMTGHALADEASSSNSGVVEVDSLPVTIVQRPKAAAPRKAPVRRTPGKRTTPIVGAKKVATDDSTTILRDEDFPESR